MALNWYFTCHYVKMQKNGQKYLYKIGTKVFIVQLFFLSEENDGATN